MTEVKVRSIPVEPRRMVVPHEGAQREVRVVPLLRRGFRKSPGQDRLHAVEQALGDQRLEIAALSANAVLRNVHDARIDLIAQQHSNRLRRKRTIPAVRQAPGACLLEHLLFGKTPSGVLLECSPHKRRPLGSGIRLLPIVRGAFK